MFNKFCEEVAQLDIYQSLAQASLENNYIRPDFGDYTQVKNGQHPMLNVLMPSKSVANNIVSIYNHQYNIIFSNLQKVTQILNVDVLGVG